MKNKFGAIPILITGLLFIAAAAYGQSDSSSADTQPFNDPPYWRQAIGGAVIGSPASQAESVVMVSDGGNVKAFSWQGRPLWDFFARGRLQPYITRSREGTTYVCRSQNQNSGTLIAINRAGRQLWQTDLGGPLAGPVITGWDGRLFIFTASRIRCFTASGYQLWSDSPEKTIAINPLEDDQGGFFLVTQDGEFRQYSAFGKITSEQLDEIPLKVIPVQMEGSSSFLLVYSSGSMELFSPGKDRIKLSGITLPARPVTVTSMGSNAAFLMADGRVCLVSLTQKKVLWTADSHLSAADFSGLSALPSAASSFESNFFYDERGIYLLTKNGASAFTEDGRRLWIIRLRGAASLPAFSDEGVLYSGGADWILYAYKLEERVK
ncbi:MAG: PQQ-like beta-propeller repeat protein, partial [Treponema sp.]|nr:PQQ-like beta-propeller repeat protein [Treponema sp.]